MRARRAPHPGPREGAGEGGKEETPTEGEASPTRAPAPHRASRSLHLGGRRLVPSDCPNRGDASVSD
ncbi:hypothetical protein VZT92_021499 [Zoarces viviparus]|uniref:Uncharacterized protein n=1 Tax=Zoarces viviparus TaxID=48416 RepID=A0AAW1ECD8_ZOAVI